MVVVTLKQLRFRRKPVVNTSLFEAAMSPNFCRWANYVDMLPWRQRSKLEKAMIMYACHIQYLCVSLETTSKRILSHRDWQHKWLPKLWQTVCRINSISRTNYSKLDDSLDNVNKELFYLFGASYDSRIFSIIKKGFYK